MLKTVKSFSPDENYLVSAFGLDYFNNLLFRLGLGQVLFKSQSSLVQVLVKSWSSLGQVLVKSWSSLGQVLVKSWSSLGQVLVKT